MRHGVVLLRHAPTIISWNDQRCNIAGSIAEAIIIHLLLFYKEENNEFIRARIINHMM